MNKDPNNRIDEIIHTLQTREDRDALIESLQELKNALFRQHGDVKEVLQRNISHDTSRMLEGILSESNDRNTAQELLEEIKARSEKLLVLQLELPFEPSDKNIEAIHEWVEKSLGKDVLLDISLDRSLAGGARIVLAGRYFQYSLSQKVDEIITSGEHRQ